MLKDCGGGNVGGRPLHVSGDGNCPFNPVSVLLRTHGDCVELVLNDKFYNRAQPPTMLRSCTRGNLPSMRSVHTFQEKVNGCQCGRCTLSPVSPWKRIRSIFPSKMTLRNIVFSQSKTAPLPIMWSRFDGVNYRVGKGKELEPNHFIPKISHTTQ